MSELRKKKNVRRLRRAIMMRWHLCYKTMLTGTWFPSKHGWHNATSLNTASNLKRLNGDYWCMQKDSDNHLSNQHTRFLCKSTRAITLYQKVILNDKHQLSILAVDTITTTDNWNPKYTSLENKVQIAWSSSNSRYHLSWSICQIDPHFPLVIE